METVPYEIKKGIFEEIHPPLLSFPSVDLWFYLHTHTNAKRHEK
jgi:hypothetical protein